MQTTAIGTVANSLPENEVILLTLLISKRYVSYTDLAKKSDAPGRSSGKSVNLYPDGDAGNQQPDPGT